MSGVYIQIIVVCVIKESLLMFKDGSSSDALYITQTRGFCLERFPLPLGTWDGLCYFIVALPDPSI